MSSDKGKSKASLEGSSKQAATSSSPEPSRKRKLINDLVEDVEDKHIQPLQKKLSEISELSSMSRANLIFAVSGVVSTLGHDKKEVWGTMYRNITTRIPPPSSDDKDVAGKLQQLKLKKLPPSACTWDLLRKAGHVPEFSQFLGIISKLDKIDFDPSFWKDMDRTALHRMHRVQRSNTFKENEGYAQTLCGPVVATTVYDLNSLVKTPTFMYSIYPIVRSEDNSSRSKKSDLSIYRLYNKITYVLIECKLSLPGKLTADNKDTVSQLLLEAIYLRCEEKESYNELLCVLTDGDTVWHFFQVDLHSKLLKFQKYISASYTNDSEAETSIDEVCNIMAHYTRKSAGLPVS